MAEIENQGEENSISSTQIEPTLEKGEDAVHPEVKAKPEVDLRSLGAENYTTDYQVPTGIGKKYLVIDGKYFDKSSSNQTAIFKDDGKKLTTSTNDREVIQSMVQIAQAKNWGELKLSGTKDFKQLAWLEAESLGIKTRGFTPSEKDLALLEELKQQRSINKIEGVPGKAIETPQPNKNTPPKKENLPRFEDVSLSPIDKPHETTQKTASEKQHAAYMSDSPSKQRDTQTVQSEVSGITEQVKSDNFSKLSQAGKDYQSIFNAAPADVQASIEASRIVLNKQIDNAPQEVKQTINDRFNERAAQQVEKGDIRNFPPPLVEERIKAYMPAKNADRDREKEH